MGVVKIRIVYFSLLAASVIKYTKVILSIGFCVLFIFLDHLAAPYVDIVAFHEHVHYAASLSSYSCPAQALGTIQISQF